ncbi:Ribose transport system permease RbsC [uncultured spirochete]|jgi:rhamnose transport system permease protein|uniref:Ribose transport system permease RbsC n=1 Tax=uncultured spirochete TaxID=156406 RepID=A0A3P3XIH1_9SPIR|nr:ABC transporter permease [Rectinema subterraneum]SLM12721.1 Ribose transport system permease RbsC [uncultured spirochete]
MQSQDKMQTGQNADGQTKAASRPDAIISSRAESTSRAETLARNTETYRELGLAIFIVILSVIFQIRNPKFLSLSNIKDMLANTAILSILTVGMMMVIITRGIDLSIGSTMALAGMITSLTVSANPSISPFLSLAQGMAVGLAAGLTIGVLVAYFNILPIIATLGLMNILRGMTYLISKGKWVSAYQMSAGFKNLSTGTTFGINNLIIFAIVIYIIYAYFINQTKTGRYIYAVGSSPDTAELIGIKRRRIILLVYALMGLLAGLAGVLWVSKFASAQGDTAVGYELNVIAATVLGGVSVAGGRGKVSGILLGSILFGILANALPLINISPFWQQFIQGLVILAAIISNVLLQRRNDRLALKKRVI